MAQEFDSLLTGLSTALSGYLGLGIQSNLEQQKETRKLAGELAKGKELASYNAELDLAKGSALEAYKLTLEGKMDAEAASKLYPEAASFVGDFEKTNKRLPTVSEFDKLWNQKNKQAENKIRQGELGEQRMNRFIQQHAKALTDKGIPELLGAYNELADVLNAGNAEGVGLTESYLANIFTGEQGIRNRTNLQQIANVLLKQRSGAAVTDQEYKRFLTELQGGRLPDEKSIKTHIGKIGQDMRSMVSLNEAGIPPEALKEFYNRPGAIKSSDVKEIKFTPKANKSITEGTTKSGVKFKILN